MSLAPSAASVWASLISHLADPALRSLALACLAALLLYLVHMKDSTARLAVWRAVLYAALAMPLMVWLMPGLHLPVPDVLAVRTAKVSTPLPAVEVVTQTSPPAADAAPEIGRVDSAPPPRQRVIPWAAVGAAIYFLIAGFFLVRLGVGLALSSRLRRRARAINDRSALAMLDRQRLTAGLRRAPELVESDALAVPVTEGVRKPAILLPAGWREWTEPKLRAVLAHELSHVARNDARTQRLAALYRCVFWFSPLGWWLERHLAGLAEQASDEAALRAVPDRTFYAEVLLDFLVAVRGARGRIQWEVVSMARGTHVERRVDRILNWKNSLPRGLGKTAWAVVLAAAMPVVCLVAAVRPAVQEKAPEIKSTTTSAIAPASQVASMAALPASAMQEPPAPPASPVVAAAPAPTPHPPVAPPVSPVVVPAPAPVAALPAVTPQAPKPPAAPKTAFHWTRYSGQYEANQAYVIVSGNSVSVSGSQEDMQHAKSLRSKISGDFIWFRHDGKGYVIRDAATVQQAKQFFAPQEELGKQQDALGKQQEELGRRQEELGKKMEEVRVKVPDMTAELDRLRDQLAALRQGGTMEQLGQAQAALGQLQSRLGALQSQAGAEQGKLGAMQGELGRQQGELGARQGQLGAEQGRMAREAREKMKSLLDYSVQKGLAQPE